jgi:hypothetical protein
MGNRDISIKLHPAPSRFQGYEHGAALAYDAMPSELQEWFYVAEPRYHHTFYSSGWSSSILDFQSTNQGQGYCGYAAVVQCFNGVSPDGRYSSILIIPFLCYLCCVCLNINTDTLAYSTLNSSECRYRCLLVR